MAQLVKLRWKMVPVLYLLTLIQLISFLQDKNHSLEDRIDLIHQTAFARPATTQEIDRSRQLLTALAKEHQIGEQEASDHEEVWKDFCHMMFNRKEFIFLQ